MKSVPTLRQEQAVDRIARQITARLSEGEALLPYEVTERLRASREQAVSIRRRADGSTAAFPHFVMDRGKPGMMTVNQAGRRFVNESTSYHLFTLAMREIDHTVDSGKPAFAHIMTVSNHRPYTYPEGRIDIPSHTSREGAVKYTDFAIAQFLHEARSKPWFDDTLFVFIADHTAGSAGVEDLGAEGFGLVDTLDDVVFPGRAGIAGRGEDDGDSGVR